MANDAVPYILPVNDPLKELVTCDGEIFPRTMVIAGVVVELATVPDTPFAVVTDTDVTDPVADDAAVGAQDADTEFCAHELVPNTDPVTLLLMTVVGGIKEAV